MEAQRSRRFTENTQRTKNHEEPLDSMDDSVLFSCPPYLPAGRRFSVVKIPWRHRDHEDSQRNTQRTKNHEDPLDSMDDSVLLSCPPYLPAGRRFSVVKNTMEAQRSRRFTKHTQRTKNHEVHNVTRSQTTFKLLTRHSLHSPRPIDD
jgi:hypothetical protein